MRYLLTVPLILACLGCEPAPQDVSCLDNGMMDCEDGRPAFCVPLDYEGSARDCTDFDDCPDVRPGRCMRDGFDYVALCVYPGTMPTCE